MNTLRKKGSFFGVYSTFSNNARLKRELQNSKRQPFGSFPNEEKTSQLETKSYQPEPKTHQLEDFLEAEKLPDELKSKTDKLKKRSKNEEVKSVIYALCSWKSLTAQEIARFINRKDKKHLVTQYLTPLVKEEKLKYGLLMDIPFFSLDKARYPYKIFCLAVH